MTYTKEQLDGIGCLIDLMRSKGVTEFKAGDLSVTLDQVPRAPIELSDDEKLTLLRGELKKQSDEADLDLLWSAI